MEEPNALPEVNSDTKAWWEATREKRLVLQRCRTCTSYQHYPRFLCTRCASIDLELVPAAGTGRVYSFTVVHRAPSPGFVPPYVVALVRVEEGPVLLTNVVDCGPDQVRCDMPVEISWRPLADGRNLPVFRPVARS
jgi:uncharacterized OB-fold protein